MELTGPHSALAQGTRDGVAAAMEARRADERLTRGEIERRAGARWDERWAAVWAAVPALGGTREEYVLLFRHTWESMHAQALRRLQAGPPLRLPIDGTLASLRRHFEDPDLVLPTGSRYATVHVAEHIPSWEPFHLLSAAGEGPSLSLRPILGYRPPAPGSTLAPALGREAWADGQLWTRLGENPSFPLRE